MELYRLEIFTSPLLKLLNKHFIDVNKVDDVSYYISVSKSGFYYEGNNSIIFDKNYKFDFQNMDKNISICIKEALTILSNNII